jgi:hypothetical protein
MYCFYRSDLRTFQITRPKASPMLTMAIARFGRICAGVTPVEHAKRNRLARVEDGNQVRTILMPAFKFGS